MADTRGAEIHPAPTEFTDAQIAADPILHFFHYAHLPEKLRATSRLFFMLASTLVGTLPRNAERTVALRKLLEAKDAAVRANLPAPGFQAPGKRPTIAELEKHLDRHGQGSIDIHQDGEVEMRETGGHDEDRDGPVPFAS